MNTKKRFALVALLSLLLLAPTFVLGGGSGGSGGGVLNNIAPVEFLDSLDYVAFDTAAGPYDDYLQGRLRWDSTDSTLALDVSSDGVNNVTLQIGQEQHAYVRNNTASDWANGAIGIVTGSVGYRPTAMLANSSYITTVGAQGMATQIITKNTSGIATTWGMVRGLDTSDYAEGDLLYVSSVSGNLTSTVPTSGYNMIFGRVIRSHPTLGIIFVNPRRAPFQGDLVGGNYVDWDYRGQMQMHGDARVWDDIRVPAQSTRINPAQTKPDFGTFVGGTLTYLFDPSSDESVHFSLQMPHSWDTGTYIEPHVHWAPTNTNTGVVVWGLECTTGAISTTFGAASTITTTQAANGTANHHHYADFDAIDMSSITTVSAMLICRLYRDADASPDTYNADAALLEIDFHYLMDKIGSREETSE